MVDQVNGEGFTRIAISVERNRRSVEEVDESINDDHDMVSTGPGSQCKHKTVGHVSVGVGLSIFGGEALTGLFAELLLQDHDKVVGYGSKHETEAEPCEHPEQAAQGIENVGDAEASIDQEGADVTSLRARVEVPETSDDYQYLPDTDILYGENNPYKPEDASATDIERTARFAKTSKLGQKDAMYVSVIQQLLAKIETLETTVADLQTRVTTLENA